jgi:sugar phosphate isomerase/epimerase
MKLGVSTYSLSRAIKSGEMSVTDVIDYIAEIGGQHAEIVPIGYTLTDNPQLVETIVNRCAEHDLDVSNYAVGANFSDLDDDALAREIERVKREVDVAVGLGAKRMRHDVASSKDTSLSHFMSELPHLAEACRRIADYAAQFGITTSVENHGYYMQGSDRVLALVGAVDRPNFRTTVDIGNFMCTDEPSTAAVRKVMPLASMVHVKDFYLRPGRLRLGAGWFPTAGGSHLRGAILGHGDIDMPEVLEIVRESGYDGYISLEFEGMEHDKLGAKLGFDYLKQAWEGR